MQWLEVTIKTVSSAIDLVGARLTAIGYDSFIIDDNEDFQAFLEDNTQYWDYVDEALAERMRGLSQIRLYIEANGQAPEKLASLHDELERLRSSNRRTELGSLEISFTTFQEEDWENSWKQYYHPIDIGEKLRILPEWMENPAEDGRLCVRLDPGMIFGTGAHASTQMCLRALEQHITSGDHVIDLGSGSGILSIAALLLGAESAVGVDIDPKAEDIARENAKMNQLQAPEFRAVTGNVIGDDAAVDGLQIPGGYDIVLANIVADVIIPLAPVVPKLLKSGGWFICSGVLNTRLQEVQCALSEAGLAVETTLEQNDWCCMTAVNKEALL